jgi:hypothetical protein
LRYEKKSLLVQKGEFVMRFILFVVGVMGVVALVASPAHAQFAFGMNYFQFSNWDNGGGNWLGPDFTDPNATTDGALWIKTGSAAPVWLAQDVNFRLDYRSTPSSPWVTITGAYLLSNGVAYLDNWGYAGYFMGADGATGWGNNNPDVTSPYRMVPNGNGVYYLPGTGATTDYPDGRPTQPGMQFNLYAWTGNYSSFSDAAAAGEHVGMSGAFQVGPTMYWISPVSDPFTNMPATVLKNTFSGDANLDQVVNISDLSKVLTNYDKTGMIWSDGDFDGSGTVDINDLSKVLANYDKAAAAGAGVKAVPEPATLLLACAGLLGLLIYGWRRSK